MCEFAVAYIQELANIVGYKLVQLVIRIWSINLTQFLLFSNIRMNVNS